MDSLEETREHFLIETCLLFDVVIVVVMILIFGSTGQYQPKFNLFQEMNDFSQSGNYDYLTNFL